LMYSKRSTCAALHLRAAATKFCTTFRRKSLDVREFFYTEPLLHLEKLLPKLFRTTCCTIYKSSVYTHKLIPPCQCGRVEKKGLNGNSTGVFENFCENATVKLDLITMF
jgi:hypothetical protein